MRLIDICDAYLNESADDIQALIREYVKNKFGKYDEALYEKTVKNFYSLCTYKKKKLGISIRDIVDKHTLYVKVDAEELEKLKKISKKRLIGCSEMIRNGIRKYLFGTLILPIHSDYERNRGLTIPMERTLFENLKAFCEKRGVVIQDVINAIIREYNRKYEHLIENNEKTKMV